jgi:hypothetical protein
MSARPAALAAAALAVLLLRGAPGEAQTRVHGTLLDDASGDALPGGSVTISTNRGRWQRSVRTDSAGAWTFAGLVPGLYRLRGTRLGFRDAGGELEIAGDTLIEVRLRMAAEAVLLEPLTVVGRLEPQVSPVLRGFYHRMRRGPGRFVSRAEIDERRPSRVTDLLRTIPNVQIAPPRSGAGGGVMSRGSAGGRCGAVVFVDGMLLTRAGSGWRGATVSLDDYVQPSDVEGIEIYRGESDTPAEFLTRDAGCGTVVVWTRRGGRRR